MISFDSHCTRFTLFECSNLWLYSISDLGCVCVCSLFLSVAGKQIRSNESLDFSNTGKMLHAVAMCYKEGWISQLNRGALKDLILSHDRRMYEMGIQWGDYQVGDSSSSSAVNYGLYANCFRRLCDSL